MKKWLVSLHIAQRALVSNKMSSALTMLGMIIGVAAVIIMISLGQGASVSIQQEIATAGSNLVFVQPGSESSRGIRLGAGSLTTLTSSDAEAIAAECPAVEGVAPLTNSSAQVVHQGQNWQTSIQGSVESFQQVRNWSMSGGVFFTDQDVRGATKVAVLGTTVVENLFGYEDPVGQVIRIDKIPFRVVGVLSSKGMSMGNDQDDVIVVPYTTAQKRLMGVTHINQILVSVRDSDSIATTTEAITNLLRQRHRIRPGEESDFHIRTQKELEELTSGATQTMTLLLAGIASVSLLVGGIGIMNILLVSVTERTREIGLRMAVGARSRDILLQFLTEAVVLSGLGGLIGIALAMGVSELVESVLGVPGSVSGNSVILAFGFAGIVGIFFGFYPARRASQLDPIVALHYE